MPHQNCLYQATLSNRQLVQDFSIFKVEYKHQSMVTATDYNIASFSKRDLFGKSYSRCTSTEALQRLVVVQPTEVKTVCPIIKNIERSVLIDGYMRPVLQLAYSVVIVGTYWRNTWWNYWWGYWIRRNHLLRRLRHYASINDVGGHNSQKGSPSTSLHAENKNLLMSGLPM